MDAPSEYNRVSILDVLAVWPCARAIFEHVPARDLVRSERVSRRWQQAVYDYLQTSCNLKLYSGDFSYLDESDHRTIEIENNDIPWSILCKTVEKLGSYIVSLTTDCGDADHLMIIESNCPDLHHVRFYEVDSDILNKLENFKALKQVSLIDLKNMTDLLLLQIFKAVKFEKIEIEGSKICGDFLKHKMCDSLISLSLNKCPSLYKDEFEDIACNLQRLTTLELNNNGVTLLQNVHELLSRIPRLENLSLRDYESMESKQSLLKSFRSLRNLKHLNLADNENVDDELIEVVVRYCEKLEYLNITNVNDSCVRSLAALCRRPSPAVTTLNIGYIQNFSTEDLEWYIKCRSVISELETLGCVELTPQWLEATALASRGREHPLELRPTNQPGRIEQQLRELNPLKVVLDSTNMKMVCYTIEGITIDDFKNKYESMYNQN